jgi:hypothetical protein
MVTSLLTRFSLFTALRHPLSIVPHLVSGEPYYPIVLLRDTLVLMPPPSVL